MSEQTTKEHELTAKEQERAFKMEAYVLAQERECDLIDDDDHILRYCKLMGKYPKAARRPKSKRRM